MSRSTLIVTAALFVMLLPFLGFPRSWEPTVLIVLGGIIVLVEMYAVLGRAQEAFFRDYEVNTEVYAERIQGKVSPKRDKSRDIPIADEPEEDEDSEEYFIDKEQR